MLLFAVAIGGVIFGAVKFNSARLVRQKEELEKIVKERTAEVQKQKTELEKNNQELAAAYDNLTKTQDQLVQSEKMAALGQLIAGVAHEINTPIGAINAANANLAEQLPGVIKNYPGVFNGLTDKEKDLFFEMIRRSTEQAVVLSSREERQYRKEVSQFLEAAGVADADNLSRDLVKIGLFKDLEPFLPLFKLPVAHGLMEMVSMVGKMQLNLSNIGLAVAKTQKIVFALKSYSHKQQSEDPVETDVVKGLETVLTLYSNQMKSVQLIKDFDPAIPVIMGHPDELNQVWTNMIHNALQAMNNAGELRVEAKLKDNNVVVKITDSGAGIPPEIMDKIFNAFFTTKPQGEGSGLGLDISRKIIDKHRGKIDVESVPGKTTFTVTLPTS
jgi:signal transduction histidine kinase